MIRGGLAAGPLVRDCPRIVSNRHRSPSIAIQHHITAAEPSTLGPGLEAGALALALTLDPLLDLSTPLILLAGLLAAFPLQHKLQGTCPEAIDTAVALRPQGGAGPGGP